MNLAILLVSIAGVLVGAAVGIPALVLARRTDRRVSSRADVAWDLARSEPGAFVVRNTGRDTAFEARAVLKVGNELSERDADEVPFNEVIEMPSNEAFRMHHEARNVRLGYEASLNRPAPEYPYIAYRPVMQPIPVAFTATVRVVWRSALGVWDTQTVESREWPEFE